MSHPPVIPALPPSAAASALPILMRDRARREVERVGPNLAILRDPVRLEALASYGGPHAPAPLGFDDVAHLAARLCGTSVAIVSLFSAERQLFKARFGTDVSELPASQTVCAYALSETGVLVIPDLSTDPRTAGFPFVAGAPHMRFYAGTPLLSGDGQALGTICVLDAAPRADGLTLQQEEDLMALARQVMAQLEQYRIDAELRHVLAERNALIAEAAAEAERQSALLALGDALREAGDAAEVAQVASRALCEMLDLARAGYGMTVQDGAQMEVVADWCQDGIPGFFPSYALGNYGDITERMRRGEVVIVDDMAADPRMAAGAQIYRDAGIRTMLIVPMLTAGRLEAAFCLQSRDVRAWSPAELRFVQAVTDRTGAEVNRARVEAQQGLLNRELGHRMKNMLAMVQAIAAQTLRGASDPAQASAILMERFHALASAHDLLLGGHVAASDLAQIARKVLGVHVGALSDRLRLDGPDLQIATQLAMSLALILHELGTNATKYGAWSNGSGHVELSWSVGADGALALTWCERGGPAVIPPLRRGFGSRLIERGLFGAGQASVDFAPSGLICRLTAAL